ncbi:MAG: putative rane protein [Herbinix sp.]|nr:putative rane protein [Herbinix sp.]
MSKINLFLQKIKLHENHHGIVMVITAYILSFLMLVLGSDLFYTIKSAAAGNGKQVEEAQEENLKTEKDGIEQEPAGKASDGYLLSYRQSNQDIQILQENLINPYGIQEPKISVISSFGAEPDDTGSSQGEDNNKILSQTNSEVVADTVKKEKPVDEKSAEDKTKAEESKDAEEKDEAEESISVTEDNNNFIYDVTKSEMRMLERIVEAEASGEDMVGKILIANVVFNRISDDEFPDSIEKVIFQKVNGDYQFSPIADERYWSVSVSKDTKEAVKRALEGEDYSKGALYFMARKTSSKKNVKWFDKELDRLFRHGGHEFFK